MLEIENSLKKLSVFFAKKFLAVFGPKISISQRKKKLNEEKY